MLRSVSTSSTARLSRFASFFAVGALLLAANAAFAGIPGDIDGDTDIDVDDISIILASRNLPAGPGDPLDLDSDGVVTVLDARIAVTLCTRALCTAGNNPPTITAPADQTINEDMSTGALMVAVSDPDIGVDPNTLFLTASSSDQALIPDANLTLGGAGTARTIDVAPVADGNGGPVTITLVIDDGVDTAMTSFTVTVTPVNDAPTLDAIADPAAILEESGQQTVNFAGITSGAANETQGFTVTATSDNAGLIPDPTVTYTSADATGSLAYTPVANESGTAVITVTVMDDGGVADGGVDAFSQMFTVTVTDVNDAPTLDAIADPAAILEDAVQQMVNLTGIGPGGSGEMQVLTVTATSDNTGLIPDPTVTYTSANATGSIAYTPVADQSGTAVITVTVMDDGGTADGGMNTVSQMFTVTVTDVNDAPTLDAIADPAAILEESGQQTVNFAGVGAGAANETQVLTVTATSDNTGLIPNPVVTYTSANATGSIAYTPVPNQSGTAVITVTVMDDGGTADGGMDMFSRMFTVTVTDVNDAPTLNAIMDPAAILEDAMQQSLNLTGIGPGGSGEVQVLSVTATSSDTGLIPDPTVTYTSANATGSIAYTPVANQSGTAVITVTVMDDGGTADGGMNTVSQMFTVAVTAVDDPPMAVLDTATVLEDAMPTAILVFVNDTDIDGGPISIAMVTQPPNGDVQITSGGMGLTYEPDANFCNAPSGTSTDDFTYTLSPGGTSATVEMTVTCVNDAPALDLDSTDATVGGNDFLTAATGGGGAVLLQDATNETLTDVDDVNVELVTITLTNVLDAGQETIAVAPATVAPTNPNIVATPGPGTLTLTGSDTLANYLLALNTITYANALAVPDTTDRVVTFVVNDGDDNSLTATATVVVTPANDPPVITGGATAAVMAAENQTAVTDVDTTDDNDSDGSGLTYSLTGGADMTHFSIVGATGVLTFNAAKNFELPDDSNMDGMYVVEVTVTDSGPGTPLTDVQTITVTLTNVNEAPIADNETYASTGNVGLAVTTSMAGVLNGDSDPDAGAMLNVTVPAPGVPTMTAMGGTVTMAASGTFSYSPPPGVDGVGADSFMYTVSDGALTDTGMVAFNITGMIWFIDGSGGAGNGTLTSPFNTLGQHNSNGLDANGECIFLEAGSYGGGIVLQTGQTLVGKGALQTIPVACGVTPPVHSLMLPGTSGTRPTISNSGGDGIRLASGNTVRGVNVGNSSAAGFGIDDNGSVGTLLLADVGVTNTVGGGIRTDSGGTITATGTNTISTTTGTALNVTGTTIGAGGITFQSISAGAMAVGPANGIVLNNTGTSGGLTVTGDGTTTRNNSGGTIQNTTSSALLLTNTSNVDVNHLNIDDAGIHAVDGTLVSGFSFRHATVSGVGPAAVDDHNAFNFITGATSVSGTVLVDNVAFTSFEDTGIDILNSSGTVNVTVSGSTFEINHTTFGNEAIAVDSTGTALFSLNVTGNTFTNLQGDAVGARVGGSGGTHDINFLGNNSTNSLNIGGGDFLIQMINGADITFDIQGNTVDHASMTLSGDPIQIVGDGNAEGRIGGPNMADGNTVSGYGGDGIRLDMGGSGAPDGNITWTVLVQNNTIGVSGSPSDSHSALADDAIELFSRDHDGTLNLTIEDNIVHNTINRGISLFTDEDIASSAGPTNNLRIVSNSFTGVGTEEIRIKTQDEADACAHIASHTVPGSGTILLDEDTSPASSTVLQITQASLGALSTANSSWTVSEPDGSVSFGGGCMNPTLPMNP